MTRLMQPGPPSIAHSHAISMEITRLILSGRGPERPELVMTSADWAHYFAVRKRKHEQRKRRR